MKWHEQDARELPLNKHLKDRGGSTTHITFNRDGWGWIDRARGLGHWPWATWYTIDFLRHLATLHRQPDE